MEIPIPTLAWTTTTIVGGLVAVFLAHTFLYLYDPHSIRAYSGPWLAKFSDLWLAWVSYHGHRSEVVHEQHQKYGTYSLRYTRPLS